MSAGEGTWWGVGLRPAWLVKGSRAGTARCARSLQHVVPAGRSLLGGRRSLWVRGATVTEQAALRGTLVGLSLYAVCLGWFSTEVALCSPCRPTSGFWRPKAPRLAVKGLLGLGG